MSECDHDMSDVEVVSRGEGTVEVEGTCPKCGAGIYGSTDVVIFG